MAKADDLMPKFSMTTVTPHKVIASLMQVNNPWDPHVIEDTEPSGEDSESETEEPMHGASDNEESNDASTANNGNDSIMEGFNWQ